MKIKYFIFIIIAYLFITSNLRANTIFFDSKNIKIEENGNMVFATKGKAIIPSNNLIKHPYLRGASKLRSDRC